MGDGISDLSKRGVPWGPSPAQVERERAALRRSMAWQDLRNASAGHLRGEDWDNEMREALIELNETDPK